MQAILKISSFHTLYIHLFYINISHFSILKLRHDFVLLKREPQNNVPYNLAYPLPLPPPHKLQIQIVFSIFSDKIYYIHVHVLLFM